MQETQEMNLNLGISAEEWTVLSGCLKNAVRNALLGSTIGPTNSPCDPGRYGSYFQNPTQVLESLAVLKSCGLPELSRFIHLLDRCAVESLGVYVTF